MRFFDNDSAIRDRAYELWEHAGRPCGHEHEHWAEARRQVEQETKSAGLTVVLRVNSEDTGTDAETLEIDRLRRALYAPEPFSFELFGGECPRTELSIVLRAEEFATPASDTLIFEARNPLRSLAA